MGAIEHFLLYSPIIMMNICSKNIFLLCFVFYIPDFQENIKLVIAQKLLETELMLFD